MSGIKKVEVHGTAADTDSGSGLDNGGDEAKILRDVLARKKKQNFKKAQPWKDVYVPDPADIPASNSPHDKPWMTDERSFNWEDSGNDTSGGQE